MSPPVEIPRTTLPWIASAVAAAVVGVAVGTDPGLTAALLVGAMSLAPFVVHVRFVGYGRALTEPTAAGIILIFYLFVFPLRGLVIALNDYRNVEIARHVITPSDMAVTLLLASLGTTVIVAMFHLIRTGSGEQPPPIRDSHRDLRAVTLAAALMTTAALAGLCAYIVQHGGIAGTQVEQLSHSKSLALSGSHSNALSLWAILASPAVWAATIVAINPRSRLPHRVVFAVAAASIVILQLVLFGSRLDALIAVVGAWIVFYFSGRAVPVSGIVAGIFLLIWLSVPILHQRPGGETAGASMFERYSRIAGYSVLDATLAVRQEPSEVRSKLEQPSRWLNFPGYLVPSALWPDKPNLDTRRMDLYVAQSLGNAQQRQSGLPTTYLTELWLYGGWVVVLAVSLLFGAALGLLHRRLVGSLRIRPPSANVLWYCFVVMVAFSYYKDGDILMTLVGNLREAVYLGLILFITGVWSSTTRRQRSIRGNRRWSLGTSRWSLGTSIL
jgi:hypothetical protein